VRIALLALHFAEYASRLALALAARHEVLLLLRSSNARNELPDDLRRSLYPAVTVRSIELPRFRDPRLAGAVLAIGRVLRGFSPDIVHVQEAHVAHNGWPILTLRRRLPVVLTVHDHLPHSDVFTTDSWRWKVVQWLRWKADRVIVHGPRMRAELAELSGARAAGRIDVIPHGMLGRTGIDDDGSRYEPATFLFFGRIEAYKGLRQLLDACDALRSRGHDFRLVVAGTGEDLERHRGRIAAAAWIDLIDRYISAAEVPKLFRRAMAVVLPYTDATQSGVAAMAFAFSRPVIATGVGDVPDVVIDGRTGLLVPPRDGKALAEAMERLLVDRALRDSLATGAARFARENLSWPRIAEATCDTYRRALSSRQIRGNATHPDGFRPLSRD
jgi:glycosyltransferase involved in cell wall biosynthesis